MIQIQISLPLLIKQKITNYLDFTIWQEKMTKICQEYNDNFQAYSNSLYSNNTLASNFIYVLKKKNGKCYNWRWLGEKYAKSYYKYTFWYDDEMKEYSIPPNYF